MTSQHANKFDNILYFSIFKKKLNTQKNFWASKKIKNQKSLEKALKIPADLWLIFLMVSHSNFPHLTKSLLSAFHILFCNHFRPTNRWMKFDCIKAFSVIRQKVSIIPLLCLMVTKRFFFHLGLTFLHVNFFFLVYWCRTDQNFFKRYLFYFIFVRSALSLKGKRREMCGVIDKFNL